MKTQIFSATNGSTTINGTLILSNTINQILFDTEIAEFKNTNLKEKNIKDVNNFIASFIRRLDSNELFDSVKVGKTEVPIIREGIKPADQTMNVFIEGNIIDQNVFFDEDINITTIFDKKTTFSLEELGFKKVTVPLDFAYSRDADLNAILAYNIKPFDYDKTDNNKILKIIKDAKNQLSKHPDAEYVFVDKYLRTFWFSSENKAKTIPFSFVIPVNLIPNKKIKIKK
jgi:hypothetical protein